MLERKTNEIVPEARMRIADVSPRVIFPVSQGSTVRISNLMSRLAERHDVIGLSQVRSPKPFRPSYTEVREDSGYPEVRWWDPVASPPREASEKAWTNSPVLSGMSLNLARGDTLRLLVNWSDVVLVEFPWQFKACAKVADVPVVYASHNVEADKYRSYATAQNVPPLRRRMWLNLVDRLEREAVRSSDLVVAVSERDRTSFVDAYGVDQNKIVVVPNGADTEKLRPTSREERMLARQELGLPEKETVIFVGSNNPPNRVAAEYVRELASQDSRFTYLLVGPVASPLTDGSLIQTGLVEDIAPYFRAADFSVVPIEYGAGTKVKLLESLASGLPTLAFPEAIKGTDLLDGEHVITVGKNAKTMVDVLHRLADDTQEADRLATTGRAFIEKHYSWNSGAVILERALQGITT